MWVKGHCLQQQQAWDLICDNVISQAKIQSQTRSSEIKIQSQIRSSEIKIYLQTVQNQEAKPLSELKPGQRSKPNNPEAQTNPIL